MMCRTYIIIGTSLRMMKSNVNKPVKKEKPEFPFAIFEGSIYEKSYQNF